MRPMIQTITHDDLLRYLYGETTPPENTLIEVRLTSDNVFRQQYEEARALMGLLDKAVLAPPPRVIEAILQYARQRTCQPHAME